MCTPIVSVLAHANMSAQETALPLHTGLLIVETPPYGALQGRWISTFRWSGKRRRVTGKDFECDGNHEDEEWAPLSLLGRRQALELEKSLGL
jgi:hypothetical protein